MKIDFERIKIKDLIKGYEDNGENGIYAYDGKLNIRPPYQREFIYGQDDQNDVIESVLHGFPLNIMYWCVTKNGTWEVLDGQQRTISICKYASKNKEAGGQGFSFKSKKGLFDNESMFFHSLKPEWQEKFLNYELWVYKCDGTEQEKLDWFKIVNKACKTLSPQELRNAIYSGPWTVDAKRYFSRTGNGADALSSKYQDAKVNRQELFEKVLLWISNKEKTDIDKYMSKHQYDKNANELWNYFQDVINWVKTNFIGDWKAMKKVEWGILYNEYYDVPKKWNPKETEQKINNLIANEEIQKKEGIFYYIFDGDEKHLNLRTFNENQKLTVYEKQNHKCAGCGKECKFEEMEGDHITAWSKGGATEYKNLQMLCFKCNKSKSNK